MTFLSNPSNQKVRLEATNTKLEVFLNLMVECEEINLPNSGRKGETQNWSFGRDDHVAPSKGLD